jgi:galactosamine-6-phosphate isomerase
MRLIISNKVEAHWQQAATDLLGYLRMLPQPLICPASGTSTEGLYAALAAAVKATGTDTSSWLFVGLDEWLGMDGGDEGSCRSLLNEQLFYPLAISSGNICFFNGRTKDTQDECRRTEGFIHQHGGIDLAIVGIGMNGHVGMNEPGTDPAQRAHEAVLHPLTQQVGQKYFSKPTLLQGGLTLGMANLMEARKLVLLANGAHKADIVESMVTGLMSEKLPASLLRHHPDFTVYLDKEAAAGIHQ